MTEQERNEECKRCNSELSDHFCSNCGHPRQVKRINGQYLLSEIGSVLNFDKGILFTVRELLLRPGSSIQKFVADDRNRLVKPIVFVIVCSLIYTVVQPLFQFEDGYVGYSFGEDSATLQIFDWISDNYGYTNVLMAVFIALWIKIFFRRYGYNFFEILILLCFVIGVGMLIFSFLGILDSLTGLKIIDKGFFIGVLYISWAIGCFFDKGKKLNYLKGFLSYMLGIFTFAVAALVLGLLVDWVSK